MIPVWCELVCGTCAKRSEGMFTLGAVPRAVLKKNAKAEGFWFHNDDCYCSFKCLQKGLKSEHPRPDA